ncbi:hypothetical protein [Amycolatopsis arida]|uniref:hypothetical protein n=1 Tax=Amycolatopsis arida TaxID=587909 RepID=UPI001064C23F|nr:hypothetical protein [Amycolatopsis arida]TDX84962.1 hypothetical protein CLV69_11746 [Amycolatopsis arida]
MHTPEDNLTQHTINRRLLAGLYVPDHLDETALETTAPIDVVDQRERVPPQPPEQTTATSPAPELPRPATQPTRERNRGEPENERPRKALPKRTIRDALVDWIDRRSHPKPTPAAANGDSEITTGAFGAVCVITIAVAALAFALSFDMMLTAAKHYGWDDNLAKLFPIIIDVGAIGGTFMGAISANRVYRQIGHQVLIVTLAASVLFNLVGHDLKSKDNAEGVLALPERWHWTGTVAAVLIPALLAYFVHAFSKALKTFTDQRRSERQAEEREREARAEAERRRAEQQARARADAERKAREQQPREATKFTTAARPAARTPATRPGETATKSVAIDVGVRREASTPSKLKAALTDAGYALPKSPTTVENWCRDIRQQLQANARS